MAQDALQFFDPGPGPGPDDTVPVQVSEAFLKGARFDAVLATRHVREDLTPLIRQLREERVAHTWAFNDCTPSDIERHENAIRPTRILSYYGTQGSTRTLVACAAISEWVAASFAHRGYAVLARCYIAPTFRGLGLYRAIVNHRVELSQDIWGQSLRGIHLSSAQGRVWAAVTSPFSNGYKFLYVGNELLSSGDASDANHWMRAFLAPSPALAGELEDCVPRLDGFGVDGCALARSIDSYLGNTFSPDAGHQLHHLMGRVWPDQEVPGWASALAELSDFCRSVLSDNKTATSSKLCHQH